MTDSDEILHMKFYPVGNAFCISLHKNTFTFKGSLRFHRKGKFSFCCRDTNKSLSASKPEEAE